MPPHTDPASVLRNYYINGGATGRLPQFHMDYEAGEAVAVNLYNAASKGAPLDTKVAGVLDNPGGLGDYLYSAESSHRTLDQNTPGLAHLRDYIFARELLRHWEREGAYGFRPPNNSGVGLLLHEATRGRSIGPQTAAAAERGGLGEYLRQSNGQITLSSKTPGQEEYADLIYAQAFRDYKAGVGPEKRKYLPDPMYALPGVANPTVGQYLEQDRPLGKEMIKALKEKGSGPRGNGFGEYLVPTVEGKTYLSKEAPNYADFKNALLADDVEVFFRENPQYQGYLPGGVGEPGRSLHEKAVNEEPLAQPVVTVLRRSGFDDYLLSRGHGIYLSADTPGVGEETRKRMMNAAQASRHQANVNTGARRPAMNWGQAAGPYVPTSATRAVLGQQGQGQPPNQGQQRRQGRR